jgi:arylformamidase
MRLPDSRRGIVDPVWKSGFENRRSQQTIMGRGLSRRRFIGLSSGMLAGVVTGCRADQRDGSGKAPIFLDYDEAALDSAYNQRVWADNADEVIARIVARNAEARAVLGDPARRSYGPSDSEGLDWYSPAAESGPVHVHFYGGGWRVGNARGNAFVAQQSTLAGAHCVIPDYVKVGDTGGDLLPLAEQCRRAVAWVYANARLFGADPERIIVSGHSAGGHLAGVVLATDWAAYGLPVDVVKKGLCVSGMYDLYPVSLSSRNEYVSFTPESIESLSPIRHVDLINAEVVVAAGTKESPEFRRQAREFAASLVSAGKHSRLLAAEGLNHFEILLSFGTPDGIIRKTLADLIQRV